MNRLSIVFALCLIGPDWVTAQDGPANKIRETESESETKYSTRDNEPLEILVPKNQRSESDFDRIHASALVTEARLLSQRENFSKSLQRYERAYRFASAKDGILREIVPLAFRLGRLNESARYAVLTDTDSKVDPIILRRLAMYLAEKREFKNAIKLYEQLADDSVSEAIQGGRVLTQFELGRLHFLTDNAQQAAKAFGEVARALENPKESGLDEGSRKALLQSPAVTYGVIAESHLQAEDGQFAEVYFRKAFDQDKKQALFDFNLARVANVRNDHDGAIKQLDKYFKSKSTDAGTQAYALLGEVIRRKEKDKSKANQEIARILEQARKSDRSNAALAFSLAQHYLEMSRLNDAERLFRELMAQQPMIDAARGIIEIARQKQKYRDVIKSLGEVAKVSNNLDLVPDAVGKIAEDKPFHKALFSIGRKTLGKNDPFENLALANVAIQSRRFDDAAQFYEAVVKSQPQRSGDLLLAWGLDLLLANETKRAVPVLRRAAEKISDKQKKAEIFYYLSGALAIEKETLEATAIARECARLQPDVLPYQARSAWVMYLGQKYDQAEQEYKRLVAKYEDDFEQPGSRAIVKDARMTLSNICVAQHRIDEAIEWLELVLDEFPSDVGAANDLGYLWADQNRHLERALRMVTMASEAEPDNFAYRDSVGWALFRLGRLDESIRELEQATKVDEPDGIVLDHLGDAYLQKGLVEKAQQAWRQALEHLGDDPTKQREKIEAKIKRNE